MTKGKNGGDNSYTPIKNPELLKGQPDKLTVNQRVEEGKNPNMRKDNETFRDLVRRTVVKEIQLQRGKIEKQRSEKGNDKDIQKDKQEPEKDKE